ncbi:hypothetical protein C0995_000343 [Termitomyces sp. Mi166|nr:hypothetical protein C0995_000343 [Termitomyces sp. Mi166\
MGSDADSKKSLDEKVPNEKRDHVAVSTKVVDTAAELSSGDVEIDPAEALRVRKKIDYHILPLMCIGSPMETAGRWAFTPKLREATHLTVNHINITTWAIALCAHAACKNFAGLFVVRLILGMCEGSITAGFLIIITGFISFGTLHIKTGKFEPWQWLMIITGIITLITATAFWFLFPDSPTNAWFLTKEERVIAIQRIKVNQTGIENKHFKKEQMIEALLDPKTWLFALFSALNNVPNSLTNQRQIIVTSFGFTALQTTLLGCVDGTIEIVTIWTGVTLAARLPNSRAYISVAYTIPNILGVFLVNFLPWGDKIGLLFSRSFKIGVGTTGFVLSLSWLSNVTSGHTKRITVNAVMLCAYCIGNSAVLTIRWLLARENRIRDMEPADTTYDNVYLEKIANGVVEQVKVDKLVRLLAQKGHIVYLASRNEASGQKAQAQLKEEGLIVKLVQLDVTDIKSIVAAKDTIEKAEGKLDVLVNNAGIHSTDVSSLGVGLLDKDQNAITVSLDVIREAFEANFYGMIQTTQTFLPLLRKSSQAVILNVTTDMASNNRQSKADDLHVVAYNTSKAAANSYTIALAFELRKDGIKVNAITPGFTSTKLNNFREGGKPVKAGAEIILPWSLLNEEGPTGRPFLSSNLDTNRKNFNLAMLVSMGQDADSNKPHDEKLDEEVLSEKHVHVTISTKFVDTAAVFSSGDVQVDPAEASRVRKKIDNHILPLMGLLYCIQFMDKSTLGSAAILGIREATHLTANQ